MPKKYLALLVTMLLLLPALSLAELNDIKKIPDCPICGMDRHKFSHSRILIHYEDHPTFGACSLHCAALELAYHPGRFPLKIEVGDYFSKKLIDAQQAVWVMGGSKMGVMTTNAKWAFADEAGARKFIGQYGGKQVNFETAMQAAYADMYKDTRMIREKRKKMGHMKKGQMTHGGHQHQ